MSTFSSQAGATRAQIRYLNGKTHLYGFRYLIQHTAEIEVSTCERVYFQRFQMNFISPNKKNWKHYVENILKNQ